MSAIRPLAALAVLLLPACAWVGPQWPRGAAPQPPAEVPAGDLAAAFAALPGPHLGEVAERPLPGNADAWTARWRLLAGARRSVDAGYFILTQDVFGMAFLGHLQHLAGRGVRVRLLIDALGRAMGSLPDRTDCLPALADHPGVEIRVYRPLAERAATALAGLSPISAAASNHDKLIVADGRAGLLGGRNIAAEYFADPADQPDAFHDLDLVLEAPAAARALTIPFERVFDSGQARPLGPLPGRERARCLGEMRRAYTLMDAWLRDGILPPEPVAVRLPAPRAWAGALRRHGHLRGALERPAPAAVAARAVLLDSPPRPSASPAPVTVALYALLHGTAREVVIASPYLVLTRQAAGAFRAAGERGVRLLVLTNGNASTDNPLSQQLFIEQWPGLAAHVPGLRIHVGGTRRNIHTKLAVFDGKVALTGAYNLDPVSLDLNGELAVALWSPELARRLAAQPAGLMEAGPPATYEYRLERGPTGRPRLGPDGSPLIAFGPCDHGDPGDWPRVPVLWRLLRLGTALPGAPEVFAP